MDNLDRAILDLLRQNARAGYGDIGSSVGLSASAVKRRVDRLVADGVIRSFTIQVDPAVDGMSTEAYVELFCRGTVAPDELQRILQGVPEVVYAGTVTGSADAIVHMRARDITSLEDALETRAHRPQRRPHAQRDRALPAREPQPGLTMTDAAGARAGADAAPAPAGAREAVDRSRRLRPAVRAAAPPGDRRRGRRVARARRTDADGARPRRPSSGSP